MGTRAPVFGQPFAFRERNLPGARVPTCPPLAWLLHFRLHMTAPMRITCILFTIVGLSAAAQVLRPGAGAPIVWGESLNLKCEYLMNPARVARILLWLGDEEASIPEIKLALIHLGSWLSESPDSSDLLKQLSQTALSSRARSLMEKRADPKLALFKN